MKTTPRELLLARHQAKAPDLDRRWKDAIAPTLRQARGISTPAPGSWSAWLRAGLREVVWTARWHWAAIASVWVVLLITNRTEEVASPSKPAQEAKAPWGSASFAQTLLLRQRFLSEPDGAEWPLPVLLPPTPRATVKEAPTKSPTPPTPSTSGMTTPLGESMDPSRIAQVAKCFAPSAC